MAHVRSKKRKGQRGKDGEESLRFRLGRKAQHGKEGKESLMAYKRMTRKGQQGKNGEEVFALIYEGEKTARKGQQG